MAGGHEDEEATAELHSRVGLNLAVTRDRPTLVWSDEHGQHSFELEGRVLVGSSARLQKAPGEACAALRIADRTVSRVHAELELRGDGVWVRDLGSRNGTWIDDVLVKNGRVGPRGRLRFGNSVVGIFASAAPARIALWPQEKFGAMLARSEIMRELFFRLAQYAATDAPVLIQGETGTGKELVARAIHDASARSEAPFVVVDCAALPETLLESELFGHKKGAFTGAVAARAGAFESAEGGTVFLDEIGELPLAMQPKLLRILESQTVRRLGETEHRRVDVRFVSATNRDLQSMVASDVFREDLYFRLAVLPAQIPPLRTHPEDLPLLLAHFLAKAPAAMEVDRAILDELAAYAWPGNVRELRAFAQRAIAVGARVGWEMTRGADVALASTSAFPPAAIAPAPAPPPSDEADGALPAVRTDVPFKALRERWVDHLEREYMAEMMKKHGRDIGAIADEAQLDRSYVHRLLRKHDL